MEVERQVTRRRAQTKAHTDFQFPPQVTGTWRALSRSQREQWLIAACNRHFKWMRRRGGWKDAAAGAIFVVDGAAIADYPAFLCALGEAINGPGGYFGGLSSLSLQDCLFGSFGVTLPFVLRILHANACRKALDGVALASWARERLAAGDFLDDDGRQYLLEMERRGRQGSKCLLDELLDEIRFHGVTIDLSESSEST